MTEIVAKLHVCMLIIQRGKGIAELQSLTMCLPQNIKKFKNEIRRFMERFIVRSNSSFA